ncbi:hypothetical protein HGRIS_006351 [Hohenbuehelia grisea]|uniref:Glycoside hydrolase family 43 protein n=1 Tax=Hohenbuehelia grisea TaxID=104357 RepID=A0ABR3K0Z5_9AGAR
MDRACSCASDVLSEPVTRQVIVHDEDPGRLNSRMRFPAGHREWVRAAGLLHLPDGRQLCSGLVLILFSLLGSLVGAFPSPYGNSTILPRAGTFTNPLNSQRGADPCMRFINGKFFLTSTQNSNIQMRSATTVEGLKSAASTVVFSDNTAGRNFDFWAPEFWFLNGRWYIYYAVAGNGDDNTHRLHVLQGGTDANNPQAGPYTYVNSLIPSNFNAWAVDGSILQVGSQLYFIFSGKTTASQWTQCTYIAPMSSPTALSGPAVQISCPTLSWEVAATPVQEGPEAITVGGVTHIVYSASHCSTDDYALGMLTLTTGANPLLASSWTKVSEHAGEILI